MLKSLNHISDVSGLGLWGLSHSLILFTLKFHLQGVFIKSAGISFLSCLALCIKQISCNTDAHTLSLQETVESISEIQSSDEDCFTCECPCWFTCRHNVPWPQKGIDRAADNMIRLSEAWKNLIVCYLLFHTSVSVAGLQKKKSCYLWMLWEKALVKKREKDWQIKRNMSWKTHNCFCCES